MSGQVLMPNVEHLQRQLDGFANLLVFGGRLREAATFDELAFVAVNDLRSFAHYQSGYFWSHDLVRVSRPQVRAASDVVTLDRASDKMQWIDRLSRLLYDETLRLVSQEALDSNSLEAHVLSDKVQVFQRTNFDIRPCFKNNSSKLKRKKESIDQSTLQKLIDQWSEYEPESLVWIPCFVKQERHVTKLTLVGGILLFRRNKIQLNETLILSEAQKILTHEMSAFARPSTLHQFTNCTNQRRVILWIFCCLVLTATLLFVPVHLSVLAPAKVVPQRAQIVRAGMDGVIENLRVKPNAWVEKDQILLTLDGSQLRTRWQIAQQSLGIVVEELSQARQASFNDIKSKNLLPLLQLKVEKQALEVAYLESSLQRTEMTASQAGVAILEQPDEMIGQSVYIGQRLMQVADPSIMQLQIQLAVADDTDFIIGDAVHFFAAAAPMNYIRATISSIDSQAQMIEGQFSFRIMAVLAEDTDLLRIGQRGTAKLIGKRVSLGYYLFRRPFASFRQWIGL